MKKLSYPLLAKWFQVQNRIQKNKVLSVSSPLLTVKAMIFSPSQFKIPYRKKAYLYNFRHVVVMSVNHRLNAYRFKTINIRREAVMDVIRESGDIFGDTRLLYQVNLNKINNFVPQSELKKHLRFLLKKSTNIKPELKPQELKDNYYLVVKDFEGNYDKWFEMQKANDFNHNTTSLQDIIIDSFYVLQFCEQRQAFYEDCLLLTQIFKKFRFLDFFNSLHQNSKHTDIKYSERFIKLVKFKSQLTQRYFLFELKERDMDLVLLRIKYIIRIYQAYYK